MKKKWVKKFLSCMAIAAAAAAFMSAGLTASAAGKFSVASPSGDFQVEADGLEGKCPSWSQAFYQYSESMENYTLEADVTPLAANPGEPGTRSGFIIGSDKAANKYIFVAIDSWNGNTDKGLAANTLEYGIEKGFGGGMGIEVPFTSAIGDTYKMKVEMKDYHVTVSIDGTQHMEFDVPEANRYGQYFGLMACIGSTLFDNVKVNGEVVYASAGTPAVPDPAPTTQKPDEGTKPAGETSATEPSQAGTSVGDSSQTDASQAGASGSSSSATEDGGQDEDNGNLGLIIGIIVVVVVVAAGVVVAGLLIVKKKKNDEGGSNGNG